MRDVIVIGAGGGGPVVAKELAQRGLSVLLLEAGARDANPRAERTHFENDANNPLTGFLRFGPADRKKPAWFRELPQNSFLFQVSGVGGTTQHYFGNCPRAYPGVFAGYDQPDADAYDTAHRFPFRYEDLIPYYEWVEATLPVQTAAMGRKERTLANREFLVRQGAALLRGAGATKVFRLDWAPLILHVQSTMRMGIDPADSVLDDTAEARAVKRLFIADNSALANALGGPNPTLTSQALATRTAEKIFERYFGGEPWVTRESPVVSTDDRVTRPVIARGL